MLVEQSRIAHRTPSRLRQLYRLTATALGSGEVASNESPTPPLKASLANFFCDQFQQIVAIFGRKEWCAS